jgi:hypothetical protein
MAEVTMKRGIFTLLVLAATGILFIPAQANAYYSVEYNVGFDGTGQAMLPEFNTAFGTLTGISIETRVDLTALVQLINLTNQARPFTDASSYGPFTITDPGNNMIFTANAGTGSVNGTAGAGQYSVSTFSGPTSYYDWTTSIGGSSFGLYQGAGEVDFNVTSGPITSSATFAPGVLAVGGNQIASGNLAITYDYDPVPIPGSAWLFGLGLIGLAGARGRINR